MWRFLFGFAVVACVTTTSAVRAEIRAVAVVGAAAPNTKSGERYYNLRNMQFNNLGELAFFAHLSDAAGEPIYFRAGDDPMYDLTPDVGIWVIGGDDSRLVARQGTAAPDSPVGTRLWLIDPTDSDDGRYDYRLSNAGVLLEAHTDGGTASSSVWMMHRQDSPTRIVSTGEVDAGSNLLFDDITISDLTDSGYALFKTGLRSPGDPTFETAGYGQWIYSTAGLTSLVRSKAPAVGLPPPTAFDSMFSSHGTLTEQGIAVFDSELAPSPEEVTLNSWSSGDPNGIWRGMRADQLALVGLSTGDDRFGVPLFDFKDPRTNERGDIAVLTRNNNGAVVFRADGPQVYARGGWAVPGADGKIFSGVDAIELSESGDIAFTATMRNDDGSVYGYGLWQDDGSGLAAVILPEMPTPTGDGSVFANVHGRTLSMNASGQIALIAFVNNTAGEQQYGLFATNRNGELVTVSSFGQNVTVAPGDERIIVAMDEPIINDRGEIAFLAHFQSGGFGYLVSDAVAVPEPGSALLLACAAGTFCVLGRRRIQQRHTVSANKVSAN
jgi:hypothetical protein